MFHGTEHGERFLTYKDITLAPEEKVVLRELASQWADTSALSIHKATKADWKSLNDLTPARPMLWVTEMPWQEMNHNGELSLKTSHPWARRLEGELRRTLYQWKYLRGDMVINPWLECPKLYHSTGFGLSEQVDTRHQDEDSPIYSRHFIPQITEPEDIFKITSPQITPLKAETDLALTVMKDLFSDILPVKLTGQRNIWYTPWDFLIRWWGVEEALLDLYLRPEMVHEAYERMVDAWCSELDQLESLGLLESDNDNSRIGSGGYGYTADLAKAQVGEPTKASQVWGCSNAQIFSEVSPEMHWEFALKHDLRWLERFGLNYYGCCEPLDKKIELLDKIPRLRKVSVSAWAKPSNMAEACKGKYVVSIKPNPAVFVGAWDIEKAEKELRQLLLDSAGCAVEIIMKDISTVGYKPERLHQWVAMAERVVKG